MMNVKSILIHHGYVDKVIRIDLMYITGETLTYIACHLLVFYSSFYNKKLCPSSTPKKYTHTKQTKTKQTKQNKEKLKQKTKTRKRWRHICGFDILRYDVHSFLRCNSVPTYYLTYYQP